MNKVVIKIVVACLCVLRINGLLAQMKLCGRVVDTNSKPVAAVSVMLMKDTTFLNGGISDEKGSFQLAADLQQGIKYAVKLSRTGYNAIQQVFVYPDTAALQMLVLHEANNTLKDVTVTTTKPLVTRKADRYIVNVENSFLANGNSGLDVLQKSPGLWVSPTGSIKIRGSQSVMVMINDVVQRMSDSELAEYLRTLRSEDISKIEVIPNPPSEYEASASGGIVHIILKKGRRLGLTGSVFSQYKQQGKDPFAGIGTSLDYKLAKLYLFGSYSYNIDRTRYTGYNDVHYPDSSNIYNDNFRYNDNKRQQYRIGGSYDFSKTQSLTLQSSGAGSTLDQNFRSGISYTMPATFISGEANTKWLRTPWVGSVTGNYVWNIDTLGSTLKAIADYTYNTKDESNTLISNYSDPSRNAYYRTITPSRTDMYSAQTDYSKALNEKSAWKVGVKYVWTKRSNTIIAENFNGTDWIKNVAGSNDFLYDEKLLMAYTSFEHSFKRTRIKVGLRGEQTYSKGHSLTSDETINRNYFGLFPSLFIDHSLDDKKGNSVHINYSRRVKRPAYNDLNPYRLQVHDYTVLTGNPDLQPQFTHSIQAGVTLWHNFTGDVYAGFTNQFIAQTASTVSGNIIEYKSKNYPGNTEYGVTLNAPVTVVKGWQMNNGLNVYHVYNDLDSQKISMTSWNVKSSHSISIKKVLDIDVYLEYTAPYTTANTRMASNFYSEIGFTRRMFNNKGRLRLTLADLPNVYREKELTTYGKTTINFYQKRPTRVAALSFNYNFKIGKEFKKKQIESSNSEEKSRM